MFKIASKNLQKKIGRSYSFRFRPLIPKTRMQFRIWWFPLIEHAIKTKTEPSQHSSVKFPDWLKAELETNGAEVWLDLWAKRLRQGAELKARRAAKSYLKSRSGS